MNDYKLSRIERFEEIRKVVKKKPAFASDNSMIFKGDSLEVLKSFPKNSVNLILTDPPYHTTQKRNIYGDTHFKKDDEYLDWLSQYINEWRRILRPNGSLYMFCSSEISARIQHIFKEHYNVLSVINWTKPNEPGYDGWKQKMKKTALRSWYAHSERIIFCEPATDENLKRSPFGVFLREARKKAGVTTNQLTEKIGAYGKVNHGGAVSNWETGRNIPSREQYTKICDVLVSSGKINQMPAYEDAIRPFNIDPKKPFTDIWDFKTIRQYKGKHPAEKPRELLDHIITTSSYEGDIVLDCFAGSGNTLVSAINNRRLGIGIEIERKWVERAAQNVINLCNPNSISFGSDNKSDEKDEMLQVNLPLI